MRFWRLGSVASDSLTAVVVCAVAAAGLQFLPGPASAESAEADPKPADVLRLAPAAWLTDGRVTGGVVARGRLPGQVVVTPGGSAVWGIELNGGATASNDVRLELRGVPDWLNVGPAGIPGFVKAKESMRATGCSRAAGATTCRLSGTLAAGSKAASAIVFRAGKKAPRGKLQVSVVATVGGTTTAPTAIDVVVGAGSTVPGLAVKATGVGLVPDGQEDVRAVHLYNMGGSPARVSALRRVRLDRVIPGRLLSGARAFGKGWSCGGQRGHGTGSGLACLWSGRIPVGSNSSPLKVKLRPAQSAYKGLRKRGGSFPVTWVTGVSASGTGRGALSAQRGMNQGINLTKADKTPTPEFKSGEEVLAAAATPHVNLSVLVLGQQRLGGVATYQVTVNNGGSASAKGVSVRITLPSHARLTRMLSGAGWKCDLPARICTRARSIEAHRGVSPIKLVVASDASGAAGLDGARGDKPLTSQPIGAVASWKAKPSKGRMAASIMSGSPASASRTWLPLLSVSKPIATNPTVTSGSGVPTVLSATIAGVAGESYAWEFQQVCRPGEPCPKVQWLGPTSGSAKSDSLTASFRPPTMTESAKLRFRVKVRHAGAVAVSQEGLVAGIGMPPVSKSPAGKRAKPTPKFRIDAKAIRKANRPVDRSRWVGMRMRPADEMVINGKGSQTTVKPGSRKRLALTVPVLRGRRGRVVPIADIVWTIAGRQVDGARTLKAVNYRVPVSAAGEPVIATAQVRYANGVTLSTAELLVSKPPRPKAGVFSRRARAPSAAFCALYSAAQGGAPGPVSIDSLSLALGSVTTAGSSCSDPAAAVNMTGGQVTVNGNGFTALTGSITAAGLTVQSGKLTLPGASAAFAFNGSPLSAGYGAAGLSGLTGSINVPAFPYLSLPGGWAITGGQLNITANAGVYAASLSATASGPNQSGVTISGGFNTDGSFTLNVHAVSVLTLTDSNGNTATFTGDGSVSRQAGQAPTYSVSLSLFGQGAAFPLYKNFSLSEATLTWDNTGVSLNLLAAITVNSQQVQFKATGSITNANFWTLTVATTGTAVDLDIYPVGQQVKIGSISNMGGTLTMNAGSLALNLNADSNFTDTDGFVGMDVTGATASLVNSCDPTAVGCDPASVKLQLNLTGSITFNAVTIPVSPVIDVNLADATFNASIGINPGGPSFGGDWGNLSNMKLFFGTDAAHDSTADQTWCGPKFYPDATYVGLSAQANLFGGYWTADIVGVIAFHTDQTVSEGMCFSGKYGTSDRWADYFSAGLTVLWASYPVTPTDSNGNPIAGIIPAHTLAMVGELSLPNAVSDYLDFSGVTMELLLGESGGYKSLTGIANINTQVCLSKSCDSASTYLELTGVGAYLTGKFAEPPAAPDETLEFGLTANADIHTPANESQGRVEATVPLQVSLGLGDSDAWDAYFSISGSTLNNQPVQDAFGWKGFVLDSLSFTLHVGMDALLNSSIQFGATVQLPDDVGKYVGLVNSPPISLAFSLGLGTDECFAFSIGVDPKSTTTALSWGDVITASYVRLAMSNDGHCTVGDTVFNGNIVIDFDGSILGTPVNVHAAYQTGWNGSLIVTAVVGDQKNGILNFAGMHINQAVLDIDAVPYEGKFDIAFSGGANLWGAISANVSGYLNIAAFGQTPLDFKLDGTVDTNLFGVVKAGATLDMDVKMGQDKTFINELDISVSGNVKVLFIDVAAGFTLDYNNGAIQQLNGNVSVDVNWYVGELDGSLAFVYKNGDADLAITIAGTVKVDMWIVKFSFTLSKTIYIDASFLQSSSMNPTSASGDAGPPVNTPNNWEYTSQMFMTQNSWAYPWVQEVGERVMTQDEVNSLVYIFKEAAGYSRGSDEVTVTPTGSSVNLGTDAYAANATYNTMTVTVKPGMTPMGRAFMAAGGVTDGCSNATFNLDIQIPKVNNPSPGDWSWVMMEVNWRLYLATMVEEARYALAWQWAQTASGKTMPDTWGGSMMIPSVSPGWQPGDWIPGQWTKSPQGYTYFDTRYTQNTYTCGYDEIPNMPSLYSYFQTQTSPSSMWAYEIPMSTTWGGGSNTSALQPGWGNGWNPGTMTLTSGQELPSGQSLTGVDGSALAMQSDGNLVLYDPNRAVKWASNTYGNPGAYLTMQSDCNLVVYDQNRNVRWASNTGNMGTQCVAAVTTAPGDSGTNLYVYEPGTQTVHFDTARLLQPWQGGWSPSVSWCAPFTSGGIPLTPPMATLLAGSTLRGGETLSNGGYTVNMQGDGNLTLYDSTGHVYWASNTPGHPGAYLTMQGDGNLVIYDTNGNALWASNNYCNSGAYRCAATLSSYPGDTGYNLYVYDWGYQDVLFDTGRLRTPWNSSQTWNNGIMWTNWFNAPNLAY